LNCDGVVRSVSSYIDGELEATMVQEVELHLKECRECYVLVQQTRLTVHLYYDSDLVDCPQEVRSRLQETLRRKIGKPRN